jgi:hypothetical protein
MSMWKESKGRDQENGWEGVRVLAGDWGVKGGGGCDVPLGRERGRRGGGGMGGVCGSLPLYRACRLLSHATDGGSSPNTTVGTVDGGRKEGEKAIASRIGAHSA